MKPVVPHAQSRLTRTTLCASARRHDTQALDPNKEAQLSHFWIGRAAARAQPAACALDEDRLRRGVEARDAIASLGVHCGSDRLSAALVASGSHGAGEQAVSRFRSGRRPLDLSSGARPLRRPARAGVGAARSRRRGAAALLPEAKHQPRPGDPLLAHLRANDREQAAPQTHRAPRAEHGSNSQGLPRRADAISKSGVRRPDTGRVVRHGRERQRRPALTIASTIHATRTGRLPPTGSIR